MRFKTSHNKPTHGIPRKPGEKPRIIELKNWGKPKTGNAGQRRQRKKEKRIQPYVPPVKVPRWAKKYQQEQGQ